MATRILLVDDHIIVRQGVMSLLAAMRPEWTIVEAGDGLQARAVVKSKQPDLVVMDITMPGASGLEVASDLRKTGYTHPILVFTMHSSARLANDTRAAGAQGYVLKSQAVNDLVRAIDTLLAGGTFFGSPSPMASPKKPKPGFAFCVGLSPSLA